MNIDVTKKTGIVLKTAGKYCSEDITVSPVLQNVTVSKNGTYSPDDNHAGIGELVVDIPLHESYPNAEEVSF